jgi:hypothetical protein
MRSFIYIITIIALAACGQKHKGDTSNATVSNDALTGTWKSACSDDSTMTFVFNNGSVTATINAYSDADCKDLVMTVEAAGTYTLSGNSIDYTYQSVTATIVDQTTVDECNTEKCYNITNWTINQGRDVAGLPSSAADPTLTPARGGKLYQIFKVTGNSLQFGDNTAKGFEGDSPDTRPTQYESTLFIKN